jgi:hypothetical protein
MMTGNVAVAFLALLANSSGFLSWGCSQQDWFMLSRTVLNPFND